MFFVKRLLSLILFFLSITCMLAFIVACSPEDENTDPNIPDTVSGNDVTDNSVEELPEISDDPVEEQPEDNTVDNTVEADPEITEETPDPVEEQVENSEPEDETVDNSVEEYHEEVRLEAIPLKIVDEEPDWNADYNKPKVDLEDIVPGLVAQNVYVGHDGWMFYGGTIKDYTEECTYSDNRLNFLSKKLIERLNFCEENGIKLYFVVTPNKNSVYPEYMATEGVEMAENRTLDVILNYLSENTELNVIDCRDGLFAAKEQYPDENLYYKLDTHWNNHGGFAAYTQIMDVISKDFPNAVTYTRDDYQIDYFDSYMKDEAYYLGWYDTITEQGPVYTLKNRLTATMTYRKDSGPYGEFIHAYIHENGYRDKTDYCTFENPNVADAPSVYVIRDSFGIALVPFITDSFSEATFNWTLGFNKDDILNKKPDIVIMQVVERSLADFFNQATFK
ncbi:MAG: hypothetical protein E7477_02835 [Ruminococcaceae bacterium]|nr:hypothetical protein [Oscillospiraceae bacterium]